VFFQKGVGNVLQENEAEDDVFVFGGVHITAQLVGGGPQLVLESEAGSGIPVFRSI